MTRYRLRFLLQEFDLAGPEVVLGRSPDCQITIEDPLISRRHARIRVTDTEALISDLGSRNGVRVNGRQIDGEHSLSDRDRIRLGTQELVFFVVERQERSARPTGFMCVCSRCGTPFPEVSPQCPHCGAPPPPEEDTISGLTVEPKRSWAFQLLGEVIERALAAGRAPEADRIMRRAAKEVDERLQMGERLDGSQVTGIASYAVRLSELTKNPEWLRWALEVHRRMSLMPAPLVLDRLEAMNLADVPDGVKTLSEFIEWWRQNTSDASSASLARLEKLAV